MGCAGHGSWGPALAALLITMGAMAWLAAAYGSQPAFAAEPSASSDLRLNEIQVLGSHNSYKLAMQADNFHALAERDLATAQALEYAHAPLVEQLDLGLRKIELDVFFDPDGTLFPGRGERSGSQFPVLHVQNLDDRSSCPDLLGCLEELAGWSTAHPRHLPIFVSINAKDQVIDRPGFVRPLPFGEDAWAALDAELRAVLGPRLIEPVTVIGAVRPSWPLLDTVRGSFLMVLDESGAKLESYASRWRERAMFANLPETEPGAAILIVNDPIGQFQRIRSLVRDGYIVRTRADADTREARLGDTERRDLAFASGAQLISTDYYRPATHFGTDYVVRLPGAGRCNPVLRPPECRLTE